MNRDDFSRVADAALNSIYTLLAAWFPAGVKDGAEFCIGSRYGEAGKSLRIRLTGERAGRWSEFSSEGEAGGDLISLYAYIHGISQGEALKEVADQIGYQIDDGKNTGIVKPIARQNPAPAQALQGVEEKVAEKPRTPWVPVRPVPDDAGPYPIAHPVRGIAERHWVYRDQERRLLGVIYRFKTSDGGKEILPCVYAKHSVSGKYEWRWMQFQEPRPLYLTAALNAPDLEWPVLIVEGEKCADAAFNLIGDYYDVVSWPGGGKAIKKADWSPLAGRHVILWPDADAKTYKDGHAQAGQMRPEHEQPGVKTMTELTEILKMISCDVEIVDIPAPGEKPDGWDVSDLIEGGATQEDVLQWIERTCPKTLVPSPDEYPSDDDGVPGWVVEVPDDDSASNVVSIHKGKSTPRTAGASTMTRRQVRAPMIPGASPGSVKGCRENVYMALRNDALLSGLVALDQFAMIQIKTKNPPWPSEPGEWTEGDDFHLGMYLANYYGLVVASVGEIEKAVAQTARENGFNPVVDMFDACAEAWDGVKRVEKAFTDYWGAADTEYMSVISRMFFVGLAKRAYVPGVKHDDAPVFEGKQGEGKSTALSILGGQWFADTPFRMGEKDGYLSIQGILIYEIAELEQFNRSEVTAVKAFMSSVNDRFREPYGRRMVSRPRRCVFGATTNEGQYFKDPTGNRRFWPVETGKIDLDGLRRDREQLLGEAVHMMRAGAKWFPTPEEQKRLISPMQESREQWDEWTGRIWEYVEGKDAEGNDMLNIDKKQRVTARELITRALHIEIGKVSQAKTETTRVSNIMRKLGWKKDRETTGAREYFYERPKPVVEVTSPLVDDGEVVDELPI